MRVLNLYACLGGNRYKWDEVAEQAGIDMQVTAVELDPELARLYHERFPNDTVIVEDAHQYLLDHYKEFDFIWSSPPCPSHSKPRYWAYGKNGKNPVYPDMKLYEEIIFLKHHYDGIYVVENVKPYYECFFNPKERDRHLYWTNINLPNTLSERSNSGNLNHLSVMKDLVSFHDYDFNKYRGTQRKLKIARNLVDYEAGRTIFETALGIIRKSNTNQTQLFES